MPNDQATSEKHSGRRSMCDVYLDRTAGVRGGWRTTDHQWVTYDADVEWLVLRRQMIAADLAGFDAVIAAKKAELASVEFEGLRLVQ